MASNELRKRVKRINERYANIVERFGYETRLAQDYRDIMQRFSTLGETEDKINPATGEIIKKGNYAIKKVASLKPEEIKLLDKLDKLMTAGEYEIYWAKELHKKGVEQQKIDPNIVPRPIGEKLTDAEVSALGKRDYDIHDIVMKYAEQIYNAEPSLKRALHRSGKGSNLTDDEVDLLISSYTRNFEERKIVPKVDDKADKTNKLMATVSEMFRKG